MLPVDWKAVSTKGDPTTNYQILPGDRLYIAHAYVDGGPVMKRWRARARGRVARIRKRTCHITVRLAEIPEQPVARAAAPSAPTEEKPKRARRPAKPNAQASAPAAEAAPAAEKPKRTRRKKTEE